MIAFYISIGVISIAALLMLVYMTFINDSLPHTSRLRFIAAISATAVVILAEVVSSCLPAASEAGYRIVVLCNVVGFALTPFVPVLISLAFCSRSFRFDWALLVPIGVNFALALLSPGFGFLFMQPRGGAYARGGYFWIFVLAYCCGLAILVCDTFVAVLSNQGKLRLTLPLLCAFLILGTSVQLIWPQVHTTWACVTMAMLMYYAYRCETSQKNDPLTGLYNRRSYESHLERLPKAESAAIIIFDVDDFKRVNDSYGHQYGDLCLQTVASCIKESFGRIGLCYRIGGDEFCVICERTRMETLLHSMHLFLTKIDRMRRRDGRLPLVSIGYAPYDAKLGEVSEAVEAADRQMYHYKQTRKGQMSL